MPKKTNGKVVPMKPLTHSQTQPIDLIQKRVATLVKLILKHKTFSACIRIDNTKEHLEFNCASERMTRKQLVLNLVSQIPESETESFDMMIEIIGKVLEKQENDNTKTVGN